MIDRKWEDAIVRAAAEASRLQPLATILFAAAALLTIGDVAVEVLPYFFGSEHHDFGRSIADLLGDHLLEVTPVIPLIWALWETRAYLGRLSKGEVWGPATMVMLGRIGDALVWSSALAVFVVPTLSNWVRGGFDFDWRFEASSLALAGLGLLLSLIARVVRNVVEVAATLKAENDQIV